MKITYNVDRLRKTVDDICILTGVSMAIANADHTFLYANVSQSYRFCSLLQENPACRERCRQCDQQMMHRADALGRPYSHTCHAGLGDAGLPIIKKGVTVGYIVLGRVRDREEIDGAALSALVAQGLDREALLESYKATRFITEAEKASLLRLLSQDLLEGAIEIAHDAFITRAINYIDANLASSLTVDVLCTHLFVSRGYLYKSFHAVFGKTVNGYISERRIQKAKELLRESDASALCIAEAVGFENYTYFTKLFKKRTGLSPKEFRKLPDL